MVVAPRRLNRIQEARREHLMRLVALELERLPGVIDDDLPGTDRSGVEEPDCITRVALYTGRYARSTGPAIRR